MRFWQPFWILAAILEFKENNFFLNGFLGLVDFTFTFRFTFLHLDLFYCFLRHLQAKICKFPEFGGHLGKMANRKNAQHLESGSKRIWIQQLKT